jgi:hypothetical protein
MCYDITALAVLSLISHILILGIFAWAGYECFRFKRRIKHWVVLVHTLKMDEIIDQMLEQEPTDETEAVGSLSAGTTTSACMQKRERLAALAAGGQIKQYLGRSLTADQVDDLADEEVDKMYVRYEARLGAAMTKTLGTAALQLYVATASRFLPILPENQPNLVHDLEVDPFVEHALSTVTCELYHRYGKFLAPLTAALSTVKYCQFGHTCPNTISEDDGNAGGGKYNDSKDYGNAGADSKGNDA